MTNILLIVSFDIAGIIDALNAPVLWTDSNPDQAEQGKNRAIPAKFVHSVMEVKAKLWRPICARCFTKTPPIERDCTAFPNPILVLCRVYGIAYCSGLARRSPAPSSTRTMDKRVPRGHYYEMCNKYRNVGCYNRTQERRRAAWLDTKFPRPPISKGH